MNNKKLKEGLCVGGKKHTVIQPLQVKITLYLCNINIIFTLFQEYSFVKAV